MRRHGGEAIKRALRPTLMAEALACHARLVLLWPRMFGEEHDCERDQHDTCLVVAGKFELHLADA